MDIKVGEYTIHSDAIKNLWITERCERVENGKTIITDNRVAGYVNNFADLYEDFIQKKWYSSNTTSLLEAINLLSKAQSMTYEFARSLAGKEI